MVVYILVIACVVFRPRGCSPVQDHRVIDFEGLRMVELEPQVDDNELQKYEEVETAPPTYNQVVRAPFVGVFVVGDDEDEDYDPEAFGSW